VSHLTGKVAVVTGATRGIGSPSQRDAERGASVSSRAARPTG